jgi:outer membrane biogenesis lipoprotein LolB
MGCFNRSFVFILFPVASVLLAGCAISGSGNPVSTNNQMVDRSNDIGYVHEEKNVTVNYPEPKSHQQRHRIKRTKVKGMYVECL